MLLVEELRGGPHNLMLLWANRRKYRSLGGGRCFMKTQCPMCQSLVLQAKNRDGPNFCPNCNRLFYLPEDQKVPSWVLGVLVILVANLQIANW
jgi:hypothetical protein